MSIGWKHPTKRARFCLICMDYRPGAHTHTRDELATTVPVMQDGKRVIMYTGDADWVASQVAKTLKQIADTVAEEICSDGTTFNLDVPVVNMVQVDETGFVQ